MGILSGDVEKYEQIYVLKGSLWLLMENSLEWREAIGEGGKLIRRLL